ncbi:MAG TPA: hypothetical protein DEA91_25365 [Paenibacillus sp.]|nr:hypothetical protein [Paenibacillus sp.]
MENKIMKVIGTTALSISLLTGVASAVSANEVTTSNIGDEASGISLRALQPNTLDWSFLYNTTANPTNSWKVDIGYPFINLYAKNTGTQSYYIEVMHKTKGTIMFYVEVPADGKPHNYINNDFNPNVPSGEYQITLYGGTSAPKGNIIMKASNTPWS